MRDLEDDMYSRRSGGAGSLTNPLSDEDYRRESRKLTDISAAADRGRRDDEAMKKISVGDKARAKGVTGVVVEKYPEKGEVYIENWERGVTEYASRVTLL